MFLILLGQRDSVDMHIPDGFLSAQIWIAGYLVSGGLLAYAFSRTNQRIGDRQVPLMGLVAAFIFAAQMLNVPVAGGTSGHALGGVLAASLLGPLTASIVMAAVFSVQALFFQDGGLTSLGANIFNMGLVGTILGYYVYSGVRKLVGGERGRYAGLAIAGWLSVVLASVAASLQIAASGLSPLDVVLPAMAGIHAVIGVVEAGVTVAVVGFIAKTRPDLLKLKKV
jgi:cobalt/nickel transport system permease protein